MKIMSIMIMVTMRMILMMMIDYNGDCDDNEDDDAQDYSAFRISLAGNRFFICFTNNIE